MKVALVYNKTDINFSDVIDFYGPQTKEKYNPLTVEKVAKSLENGGHNVKVIEGNINVIDELKNFMPKAIEGEQPGLVFNMAYGIQGRSRYTHIPALLEMVGIPYVGSGPDAHAVALDKIMTKMVFQQHGIPTPDFWSFESMLDDMSEVVYPVIVKPKMESVSLGIAIVHNENDLRNAVSFIVENFKQAALVEQFIPGREFAVGMLGNGPDLEVFPVVEFDFGDDPNAIQTEFQKKKQPIQKVCPANISQDLTEEIQDIARKCFRVLGIQDFARIDLRMDEAGNLFVLEINSMASLGPTGSYFKGANMAGYTYESLVNRMLEVAAIRHFGEISFSDKEEILPDQPLRLKVRSHARSQLTTMLSELKEMVDINSYVYNAGGVNALGNWFIKKVANIGFHPQIIPQTDVGNIVYLKNHTDKKNDILVVAHLDNPFNYSTQMHFFEERGRVYGTGVAESKGGLVILLEALRALRYNRRINKVKCGILLIPDDSLAGKYSRKYVNEFAGLSKYAVDVNYGNLNGGIVTSSSGSMQYHFEFANNLTTQNNQDVIKIACEKMLAWQKLSEKSKGLNVIPVSFEGKTFNGFSSDYASGILQAQFLTTDQGDYIENQLNAIASRNIRNKVHFQLRQSAYHPPFLKTDENLRFYKHVEGIAKRLEIKISPIHRDVPSDINHVPNNVPSLGGLGPLGGDVRTSREFIVRDSLVDRAALLAMILRLSALNFQ